MLYNYGILGQTVPKYFALKSSGTAFSCFFSRNNFVRPEVANDAISVVVVGQVGTDVRVKFGDSRSNRSGDIRSAQFVTTTTDHANYHRRQKRHSSVSPK